MYALAHWARARFPLALTSKTLFRCPLRPLQHVPADDVACWHSISMVSLDHIRSRGLNLSPIQLPRGRDTRRQPALPRPNLQMRGLIGRRSIEVVLLSSQDGVQENLEQDIPLMHDLLKTKEKLKRASNYGRSGRHSSWVISKSPS